MDKLDGEIVAALRRDGRMALSDLAGLLGVARATARARLMALEARGEVVGFTVLTRGDVQERPVRGLMMLGIEGRGTERIIARLQGMPEVELVHTTNGAWDLIVQIGTDTLGHLDEVLFAIRRFEGVTRSETNLLLSTRRAGRPRAAR